MASNVKVEPGIKQEVKQEDVDMANVKGEMSDDEELYEDAGDLDMAPGGKAVWLVKLPSFVAERWNDIDEDEEIVLGVVKVNPKNNEQVGGFHVPFVFAGKKCWH